MGSDEARTITRGHCVHVLISTRWKEPQKGDTIPLYENILLIKANENSDVWRIAEEQARLQYCFDDESFTMDGRPCFNQFEGIRKVVSFELSDIDKELTYLEFEVSTEDDIQALLNRQPVQVSCYDDLPAEQQ